MAANSRTTNTALKKSLPEQILESPTTFDFDQLVYVIESIKKSAVPLGEGNNPKKEAIRTRAYPLMYQEPTEIHHLETTNTPSSLPEVYTNFLNLVGVNGPLPMPYTELLLERLKEKDKAGIHFLDIFNHRLISLWHKLRKKTYPQLYKSTPAQTPIGRTITSLSGFAPINDVPHTIFFDHYWRRPRSIYGILQMIKRLFKVTATATSLEGTWHQVEPSEGSKIGMNKGQFQVLGKNSILGLRCWDQSAGFTISLPVQEWQAVQKFLPFKDKILGGDLYQKLQQLILSYMGTQPRIFLKIALQGSENKGTTLNKQHALGWNSWLKGNTPDTTKVRIV